MCISIYRAIDRSIYLSIYLSLSFFKIWSSVYSIPSRSNIVNHPATQFWIHWGPKVALCCAAATTYDSGPALVKQVPFLLGAKVGRWHVPVRRPVHLALASPGDGVLGDKSTWCCWANRSHPGNEIYPGPRGVRAVWACSKASFCNGTSQPFKSNIEDKTWKSDWHVQAWHYHPKQVFARSQQRSENNTWGKPYDEASRQ